MYIYLNIGEILFFENQQNHRVPSFWSEIHRARSRFYFRRVFGQNLVESIESAPDIFLFIESQVRNSSSPSSPSSRRFSRRVNRRVNLIESVRQGVLPVMEVLVS